MTGQISRNTPSISPELADRLSNLRQKMNGFSVVNSQGEILGTVQDLVVDKNQHLNLVVERSDSTQAHQSFLIASRFIQHVYPRSRKVVVMIDASSDTPMTPIPDTSRSGASDAFGEITIEQDNHITSIDTTLEDQPIPDQAAFPQVVQEETIRLLEERLKVDYQKHKVGEVIVRKEVETEMIQVPVRREKLIVEQISPDHRQLAEIDLGQGDLSGILSGIEVVDASNPNSLTVTGNFSSPKTVAWLFDAIARQSNHGCKRIRINVELEDANHAELYRSWFEQSSFEQDSNSGSNAGTIEHHN